jgi:hypothetical protein
MLFFAGKHEEENMKKSMRALGLLAAVVLSPTMAVATSSAQSIPQSIATTQATEPKSEFRAAQGESAAMGDQASQAMMQGMMKTMQGMMAMMQKQSGSMMPGMQPGEDGARTRRGGMRPNCDFESSDSSAPAMMQMMQGMMQMMQNMHKQIQSTEHSHDH